MNTKLKLLSGLLIAGLANSANANLITEWTYNNQAGFEAGYIGTNGQTNISASGNSADNNPNDLTDNAGNILDTNHDNNVDATDNALYTLLEWGTPANGSGSGDPRSGLRIDSPISDAIATNDANWAQGTSIIHRNWQIVGDSLTTASVLDGLNLIPTNWVDKGVDTAKDAELTSSSPYFAPQLQFGINFFETSNGATDVNGNCPNGSPNFVGDNANGCGDIFEITGLESLPLIPVVGPDFIEFTVPFVLQDSAGNPLPSWNDVEYFVTTRLSGLTTLPSGYVCSNSQPNCFGFVTKEDQRNVLNAELKIRTVPEPTTLAIFGLGLLATGLSGRRKRKA